MKLMHGCDDQKRDKIWVATNYFFIVLFSAMILFVSFSLLYIAYTEELDIVLCALVFAFILMMNCGLLDASWRNGKYRISEDGIHLEYPLGSRVIRWNEVSSAGVHTVLLINHGMPRDYIIIHLSEDRTFFPVNLSYCSVHRKKMVAIRSTPERVVEMKKALLQHSVPWSE